MKCDVHDECKVVYAFGKAAIWVGLLFAFYVLFGFEYWAVIAGSLFVYLYFLWMSERVKL